MLSASTPRRRAIRRAAGLSVIIAIAGSGSAFAADPPDFCVANPTSSCPSAVAAGNRASTFAGLRAALDDHGNSFDTVIVEPGTYTAAINFTGPADVTIYGDPAGAAPTITSSGATSTFATTTGAPGLKLSHLNINHTGAAGAAFAPAAAFALTGVAITSTGAGISATSNGAQTLTNVTVTSTAPATATPLVSLDSQATLTINGLTVNAEDRATGLVVSRAAKVVADHVRSRAFATVGGTGGYGMLLVGEQAGSDEKPEMTLSHADLEGGAFGLAVYAANAAVDNSLLESDGDTPPVAVIGPDSKQPPFPAAGVASGVGSTVDLSNVTAVAAGTTSDGIVANSARSAADDDPFAYAAFIRAGNSIFQGGALDVEVTPQGSSGVPGAPLYQRGRIGLSYVNASSVSGPTDAILGDATVQSDDPLFVNPAIGETGDFHVQAGSRTLRAGGAVPAGDTDLDGKPRPDAAGSSPDLGAYESTAAPGGPATPLAQFAPPVEQSQPPSGGTPDAGGTPATSSTSSSAPSPAPGPSPSPAPIAPSAAFTIDSVKVAKKTGSITLVLNARAAGVFSVNATTSIKGKGKHAKAKTVTFATGTAKTSKPSAATVTLKPSSAAGSGLKGGKKEKVTVVVTFTPAGGQAASISRLVTVSKK